MMSKTHLAVGIAAALTVSPARTVGGVFAAVIGGALGGVLCDVECKTPPDARDIFAGQMGAGCLTVMLLCADAIMRAGLWDSIRSQNLYILILGVLSVILLTSLGHLTAHRSLTHSLLYVALLAFGLSLVSPMLLYPALAGGISHLALDTLNKKSVPWLYPIDRNGFCLKLCRADRTANAVFFWLGFGASVALLAVKATALI